MEKMIVIYKTRNTADAIIVMCEHPSECKGILEKYFNTEHIEIIDVYDYSVLEESIVTPVQHRGGTLKIKDILGKVDNVDVYDDFTGELGVAYCGETLTLAGAEKFAEVLELDCNINGDNVIVEINKLDDGEDERLLQLAIDMFESMAGLCSESDYKNTLTRRCRNV